MVVDRKLSRGSLDRGARRQKTLDPHTFGMTTTLAPASWEPPSSRHLFPHHYISKDQMQRSSYECCAKNSPNIVQNFGAVMATYILAGRNLESPSTPAFFPHIEIEIPECQALQGWLLVASFRRR